MAQLELEKAAIVRMLPNESCMTVQVQIAGKVRNLDRPQDEFVAKPLMRLQKAACQNSKKKKKNSKDPESTQEETPEVSIFMGPDESYPLVDPDRTTNRDAWRQDYLLKIGHAAYSIIVNPPSVEKIHIHGTIFPGVPIVPHVDAIFTDFMDWQWQIRNQSGEWVSASQGRHCAFTPSEQDFGCMLRVSCTPIQNRSKVISQLQVEPYELRGVEATLEVGPVVAAPRSASAGRIPPDHSWTTHPDFRVMTYNILADQYASTDTAKNEIFSHCPNEFLEWQYRRPLIFKEILDYKPDIACLQEVDASAFNLLLQPGLNEFGLEGVYTNKAGRVKEGGATFWKSDRFQMLDRLEMEMRQYFPKTSSQEEIDQAPLGPALRPMLESSPNLCEALQKVGTVAQLTLLVPRGPPSSWNLSRPLCVINTHLFYHYAAPHVRTIHVWAMLHQAKEFIDRAMVEHKDALGGARPSLLFCGDLNSDINDGIPGTVELLRTGHVREDYWDWKFGTDFAWGTAGRGEEDDGESGEVAKMVHSDVEGRSPVRQIDSSLPVIPGMALDSPFSLESADGMIPEFTNYVKGYQGLLDYVWFQTNFVRVKTAAHCPTKEELQGYLPSEQYPSDHLAVVADLQFVEERQQVVQQMRHPHGTHMEATFRNVPFAEYALCKEQVIAVPTDTIYGIAGLASSSKSIEEIYRIKRRDFDKPLAVCVADHEDIADICHVDHLPPNILKQLLPGPVTVVLDRKKGCPGLSDDLNRGVDAIAVRIPDFPFLRAICRQVQTPLALTSANISGDQSPVRTDEMGGVAEKCALIFDHGFLGEQRSGSTIIDLRKHSMFSIIREGSALEETLSILTQHGLVLEER